MNAPTENLALAKINLFHLLLQKHKNNLTSIEMELACYLASDLDILASDPAIQAVSGKKERRKTMRDNNFFLGIMWLVIMVISFALLLSSVFLRNKISSLEDDVRLLQDRAIREDVERGD